MTYQLPIFRPKPLPLGRGGCQRAFGKPRQEVEHSGDAGQPLEILIRHFSDEAPNSVEPTELDDQPRLL